MYIVRYNTKLNINSDISQLQMDTLSNPEVIVPNEIQDSTGTTIMACKYDNGIMFAADSRTTRGIMVMNRVSDKISPIHKRIVCLRSGVSAHTIFISNIVQHYINQQAIENEDYPHVKSAAGFFRYYCYNYKNFLQASIIVGGWDPYDQFQLYAIPLGGTVIEQDIVIGGSGSSGIQAFCDANYRQNMTKNECKEFIKNAVSHAMSRDTSSGGVIRILDVTKDAVEREYISYNNLPVQS